MPQQGFESLQSLATGVAANTLESLKLLFSQKQSAWILGVSLRTPQNLIASNQIPVRRIGRRVLIHRKALEAFARRDHPQIERGGE